MPIFYTPDLTDTTKEIILSGTEFKHIKNTLRKKVGDILHTTNGNGLLAKCSIKDISPHEMILQIESIEKKEKSHPHIALAFALLKQHNELIIEKCTEIGVYEFFPFYAKRNVKTSLSDNQFERLQKIAIAAVKQCDSTHLPKIHKPFNFKGLLQKLSHKYTPVVAWEEERQQRLHNILNDAERDICLIVGPEGGFEKSEIDCAGQNSAQIVSLGNHILRAETAAITITANTIFYQLGRNPKFY
ncbi:MAG: 16S rRNA (uracil(1498)-N(3))-methyltransferase [Candidatus Cloacimonetes bacterium]|nr:16S rRNA (uracil(1498)-N(3))-methyltransferase [Candidatus Cloacimonadota bacterium]